MGGESFIVNATCPQWQLPSYEACVAVESDIARGGDYRNVSKISYRPECKSQVSGKVRLLRLIL
jgi:hypothetical protein